MKVQALFVVWTFTALCLVSYTAAFSHGASISACTDMRPKHIRAHLQNPQNNYITIHTNMSFFPGDKVPGKNYSLGRQMQRAVCISLFQGHRLQLLNFLLLTMLNHNSCYPRDLQPHTTRGSKVRDASCIPCIECFLIVHTYLTEKHDVFCCVRQAVHG